MQIFEEAVLTGLNSRFPDLAYTTKREGGELVIEIPSQNPNVAVPLRLVCHDYPALYWHEGYFFDFIWGEDWKPMSDMIDYLLEFLDDFFNEGFVAARGGPHDIGIDTPRTADPRYWARSWRGTYDVG